VLGFFLNGGSLENPLDQQVDRSGIFFWGIAKDTKNTSGRPNKQVLARILTLKCITRILCHLTYITAMLFKAIHLAQRPLLHTCISHIRLPCCPVGGDFVYVRNRIFDNIPRTGSMSNFDDIFSYCCHNRHTTRDHIVRHPNG